VRARTLEEQLEVARGDLQAERERAALRAAELEDLRRRLRRASPAAVASAARDAIGRAVRG
jgi:hypothetical protein